MNYVRRVLTRKLATVGYGELCRGTRTRFWRPPTERERFKSYLSRTTRVCIGISWNYADAKRNENFYDPPRGPPPGAIWHAIWPAGGGATEKRKQTSEERGITKERAQKTFWSSGCIILGFFFQKIPSLRTRVPARPSLARKRLTPTNYTAPRVRVRQHNKRIHSQITPCTTAFYYYFIAIQWVLMNPRAARPFIIYVARRVFLFFVVPI